MKNIFYLPTCLIAVMLVLSTGCIKEPSPGNPHLPGQEWLLTKVVAFETRGEPEGGPVYYSVTVDEYRYNKNYKPWLHIQYYGPDTNHLKIRQADTLFYDNQLRTVRRGSWTDYGWKLEYKLYYTGNDRYPNRVEEYSLDSAGAGTLLLQHRYLYRDTLVYRLDQHSTDTLVYVYNKQGDYLGIHDPYLGLVAGYDAYDNSMNAGRFLNIDFAWILNIPEGDEGPLFSQHNWAHFQLDDLYRYITYDSLGRVSKSAIRHQFPTRNVNSFYYYTKS